MKILLLGQNGCAHALTWKLLNSTQIMEIVCVPGNGGTAPLAAQVDLEQQAVNAMVEWCFQEQFEMIVPAQSTALVAGLADQGLSLQVGVCGPPQRSTILERSRCQAKDFMLRYRLPTAPGRACRDIATAERFLATQSLPVILKSDHPAGGERIYDDRYAALAGLRELFAEPGLEQQQGVVIESLLQGPRVVLSAFTDGRNVVPLLPTRLYDRVGDGDQGAQVTGTGAHTSNSAFSQQLTSFLERRFLMPIVQGMAQEQLPYWGILSIDCIITQQGPQLTAIRCSLHEGEAQVVLPRLNDDLLPWLLAMMAGRVNELPAPQWSPLPTVGIGLLPKGYPVSYVYGSAIRGIEDLDEGVMLFHSNTAHPAAELPYTPRRAPGSDLNKMLGGLLRMQGVRPATILHTTPGLVMTVVTSGVTLAGARGRALVNAERIQFDGRSFRSDIGVKEFA